MVGVDQLMKAPSMHIHGRTTRKTVYPPQTKFAGGIKIVLSKAVVGVDQPMKAPSMHIQTSY